MILLLGYGISNKSIAKYLDKIEKDYIIYDDYANKTYKVGDFAIRADKTVTKKAINEKIEE